MKNMGIGEFRNSELRTKEKPTDIQIQFCWDLKSMLSPFYYALRVNAIKVSVRTVTMQEKERWGFTQSEGL